MADLKDSPLGMPSFAICVLRRFVQTRWYDFELGVLKFSPSFLAFSVTLFPPSASVHEWGRPLATSAKHFRQDTNVDGSFSAEGGCIEKRQYAKTRSLGADYI